MHREGRSAYTFNPGKESTYSYLSGILKETDALFPSQMIHLGGDGVSLGNKLWDKDPAIRELMKKEDLADLPAGAAPGTAGAGKKKLKNAGIRSKFYEND